MVGYRQFNLRNKLPHNCVFCCDFSSEDLPESTYKFQLLGLNLLRLLAQNKLAEFHTVSYRKDKTSFSAKKRECLCSNLIP